MTATLLPKNLRAVKKIPLVPLTIRGFKGGLNSVDSDIDMAGQLAPIAFRHTDSSIWIELVHGH